MIKKKLSGSILILVMVYMMVIVMLVTTILTVYKNILFFNNRYNKKEEFIFYQKQNINIINSVLNKKKKLNQYIEYTIGDYYIKNIFLSTNKMIGITNFNINSFNTNSSFNIPLFEHNKKYLYIFSVISNRKSDLKVLYFLKKRNKFFLDKKIYLNY